MKLPGSLFVTQYSILTPRGGVGNEGHVGPECGQLPGHIVRTEGRRHHFKLLV